MIGKTLINGKTSITLTITLPDGTTVTSDYRINGMKPTEKISHYLADESPVMKMSVELDLESVGEVVINEET